MAELRKFGKVPRQIMKRSRSAPAGEMLLGKVAKESSEARNKVVSFPFFFLSET